MPTTSEAHERQPAATSRLTDGTHRSLLMSYI